jgi:hypothetical protein
MFCCNEKRHRLVPRSLYAACRTAVCAAPPFLTRCKRVDWVAVARLVGYQVPTMMHAMYSSGASREALLRVADQAVARPLI